MRPVAVVSEPCPAVSVVTGHTGVHAVPGEVHVSLKRAGSEAILSVEDDGIGLSAEVAMRAFEPATTVRQAESIDELLAHF